MMLFTIIFILAGVIMMLLVRRIALLYLLSTFIVFSYRVYF